MRLLELKVSGFRNIRRGRLSPAAGSTVLVGDNGQGKTNWLEAIAFLSMLRSFRTSHDQDLVQAGAREARLEGEIERGGLSHRLEVTIGSRGKLARRQGKLVRSAADYVGTLKVVVFEPADLGVVRGSPSYRRRLLDRAVFNWRSGFLGQAQTLDRVLRSRNAVLRGGRTSGAMALLEVYDQQLATAACKVAESRVAYLAALRPVFRSTWTEIFGPAVQADLGLLDSVSKGEMKEDERVSGRASAEERTKASSSMSSTDSDQQSRRWEAHFAAYEATILALLEGSRPADFARGCTTVGPHRDDLEFRLDGRRAAAHASQGQLRALCLAFKIAEVRLLRTASGEDPVLLLDDVSSELDASRNHNLIELLGVASGQAIWTTTERRHLARTCDNALCFQVVGGELLAGSGSELLPGS